MARKRELAAIRAAKARKRRRRRRRLRAVILMFETIILLSLMAVAFVMAKYDKFQRVDIDKDNIEVNEGIELTGYTTVALFGGDSREGQLEEGTHADTIIIVAIDNETKEIRMASIYRDTLLRQMDDTYKKANNAYFVGGPGEAISMLNKNLDLDIEDYATVDFKAMADVVDLMGGIEIEVTDAEADMLNDYVGETAKAAKKKANKLDGAGTYLMDGPQAVTYARLRKLEGGDYKRTERQRTVIMKLFEKVKTTDIATLNEIIDTVFPQVSTSFTLKKIIGMSSALMKYKLAESEGFPFEKTDGVTYPEAGDVVVAQGLAENVRELHEFLYPHKATEQVSDTVQMISDEIMNLTGVVRPAELDEDAGEGGDGQEDGLQEEDGYEDADVMEDDGYEDDSYTEDEYTEDE
jgi:LCP family protein required for cell wall assembly